MVQIFFIYVDSHMSQYIYLQEYCVVGIKRIGKMVSSFPIPRFILKLLVPSWWLTRAESMQLIHECINLFHLLEDELLQIETLALEWINTYFSRPCNIFINTATGSLTWEAKCYEFLFNFVVEITLLIERLIVELFVYL